ncbi:MAG TPA: ribosomal protein L7/L12 [Pirellulales bacterium]|nr:ribosomal protein L7/L12 [Pirellulales bacterium]
MADDANLAADLRDLLAAGRKIEAIKRYREATGVGLAEAKSVIDELIEKLARGAPRPADASGESDFEQEIVSLLEQGRKIAAIKVYRERTGAGLKEAKEAVEAVAANRGIVAPSRSGCLGLLLFAWMIGLYWLFLTPR